MSKLIGNMYLLWWFVWLELSIDTKKGTMMEVSNKTYWILIINVVAFIIMYLLVDKKYSGNSINLLNKKKSKDKVISKSNCFDIKTYQSGFIVWIIGILMMFILIFYLRRYTILLDQYGMSHAENNKV